MQENENFDFDRMVDELASRVGDSLTDQVEDALLVSSGVIAGNIEDTVVDALREMLPEAISGCLSNFEFTNADGAAIKPKQQMKVLSPDKTKLLLCHGGLRVENTDLMVQTGISSWENIATCQSREEAVEALVRVKDAMENGLSIFEL